MSAQPPDKILDIPVVGRFRHLGETPAIVWVKQDQVCFDAQLGKLVNAPLKMTEEVRVKTGEVPVFFIITGKRVPDRLVSVEDIRLREHAHPKLAERRFGQRRE